MMAVRCAPILAPGCRVLALLALLAIGCAAAAGPAGGSGTSYLPGFPDVPLMQGLDVEEGDTVVFDKPNGRIAEVSAVGAVSASDLVTYYLTALPALGWREGREESNRRQGRLSFVREGEILQIEFAPRGRVLDVRFFLSPS